MSSAEWHFDVHIHTSYSRDACQSVKSAIKHARKARLDAIAITDHNTIEGAVRAKQINDDNDFLTILGEERRSDYGDIIGIFLTEPIRSRIFCEIIDEIHDQDAICILPHPMRRRDFPPPDQYRDIDLFETINSRTSVEKNNQAHLLAVEHNKPEIAGSDSHFFWEIGTGWNHCASSGDLNEDELHAIIKSGRFHANQKPISPRMIAFNQGLSYFLKKSKRFASSLTNQR